MSKLSEAHKAASFIVSIMNNARIMLDNNETMRCIKTQYLRYQLVDSDQAPATGLFYFERLNACRTKEGFRTMMELVSLDQQPAIKAWDAFMQRVREAKATRAALTVDEAHAEALQVNAAFDLHTEALQLDEEWNAICYASRLRLANKATAACVANFPAYSVIDLGIPVIELTRRQAQKIEFATAYESSRYGTMYNMHKIGGVAAYAGERGADEKEAVERAIGNGHELFYSYPLGVSITSHQRDKECKILLKDGTHIRFDGQLLRVKIVSDKWVHLEIVG